MDAANAAEILGRALHDDRLVVLVGAYASASSRGDAGRDYDGLPTPDEFVALATNQFGHVTSNMTFNQACDSILERERRAGLEDFLLRYYQVPDVFDIPPSHRMLAWLPFSMYITSNYDQFIERSLARENRHPFSLIDNEDLTRLKPGSIPIVKYHGCVTRPASMVAASTDYDELETKRKLIYHYLAGSLPGKSLLVVGQGLSDNDLSRLLSNLKRMLNDYTPHLYVLRKPDGDDRISGFPHAYDVINEDLTQFLSRLLHQYRQQDSGVPEEFNESWLSSAFFAALKQAAVLPSETQVIDTFLAHLRDEIIHRPDVHNILADAKSAVNDALKERPNNKALKRTWDEIEDIVSTIDNHPEIEHKINDYIDKRNNRITAFKNFGAELIKPTERILLFSQSQRVLQVLKGVPSSIQRTVHLFVAECRPKSPLPYQDAAAICAELRDTFYTITVCPDVVAMNFLSINQIDRVMMGTHALYSSSDTNNIESIEEIYSFVNTCGSLALSITATAYGIPLTIIGEENKIEFVPKEESLDNIDPHQENDLSKNARNIRGLRTRRADVSHLNIGYDLVDVVDNITVCVPDLNWDK